MAKSERMESPVSGSRAAEAGGIGACCGLEQPIDLNWFRHTTPAPLWVLTTGDCLPWSRPVICSVMATSYRIRREVVLDSAVPNRRAQPQEESR